MIGLIRRSYSTLKSCKSNDVLLKMPIKISLEGNIGTGKSTFLRLIEENLKNEIKIMDEPLELWRSMGAKEGNLLELFYKDPVRWSYTFQSFAFYSRVMIYNQKKAELDKEVVLFERSLYSDKFIFAQNSFNTQFLNRTEWDVYNQWFGFLVENIGYELDGIVYLRCSPNKSYERVKKRAREEEDTLSLSYLETLHERHESWLVNEGAAFTHSLPNSKQPSVLIIDVEEEFEEDKIRTDEMIREFKVWLNSLKAGKDEFL